MLPLSPTLLFSCRSMNLLLDLGNGLPRIEALRADLHHEAQVSSGECRASQETN